MPVALTDEMADLIKAGPSNSAPCILVTVLPDGYPNPSFRGSLMVFDNEHLAYWDRSLRGAIASFEQNPKAAMLFRDPGTRKSWRFYGTAELHREGPLRDQVMARTPQNELDADPERKGVAVLIRVDRVIERGQTIMER